jgi:hypothetical protein
VNPRKRCSRIDVLSEFNEACQTDPIVDPVFRAASAATADDGFQMRAACERIGSTRAAGNRYGFCIFDVQSIRVARRP